MNSGMQKEETNSLNRKAVYLVESLLNILRKKVIHPASSQIAVEIPSLAPHN